MNTIEIKKIGSSEIEIIGELPASEFEGFRDKATKKIGGTLLLDGFRPGHIPERIVRQTVGEAPILEEMAEIALGVFYPKLLEAKNIEAIGRPEISITKLASGNPLGFKIKTAVLPEVVLPAYADAVANIVTRPDFVDVTDKDVEETIAEIRKNWARSEAHVARYSEAEAAGTKRENHAHEEIPDDQLELPEFNDEFVKNLGKFENVDDFRAKLRGSITEEKEAKIRQAKRADIVDALLKVVSIDIPAILVKGEQDKMFAQFQDNIARMGVEPEEYMKQANKTEESIKEEMKGESERRAKTQLILNQIAKDENIHVPMEQIRDEVNKLLQYYKGADPVRAELYVEQLLTNEKVFQLLESQK